MTMTVTAAELRQDARAFIEFKRAMGMPYRRGEFELNRFLHFVAQHYHDGGAGDTLAEWKARGKMPKMLWHHGLGMSSEDLLPIGYWTGMEEDDHGLRVEGQLIALDTDRGRTLHEGMMAEAIDAMSISYSVAGGDSIGSSGLLTQVEAALAPYRNWSAG